MPEGRDTFRGFESHSLRHYEVNMLVSTYDKDGRLAEIHQENNHFLVKLYENGRLYETKDLSGHSIHYAESLAENFVERVGSFYTGTQTFLRD